MPRRDFSKVAFAATGDVNTIPGTVQPDGSISLPSGWGFDYERDNGAGGGTPDPLAKNIDREDMNGILNEITASVGEIQQNGFPIWVVTGAPYPLNAVVRQPSDDKNYRSTVVNNSTVPGALGANWVDIQELPVVSNVGVQGSFKNMSAICTGLSASVTFTADEITLRNSSNLYLTVRNVSISANTGAASGAANSLDTGSWAFSTWYARHVIYNPSTGTTAVLWSLSRTAPTLPSGYTFWAYTGQSERTQPATNFNPLAMQWTGRRGSYIKGSGGNVPFLPVMATGNQGSPVVPTYVPIAWAAFAPPDTYELDLVARVGVATAQIGCAPNNNYLRPGDANQSAPTISHLVGNSLSPLSIRQMIPVESGNIYYTSDDATYSLLQCCGFNTKG